MNLRLKFAAAALAAAVVAGTGGLHRAGIRGPARAAAGCGTDALARSHGQARVARRGQHRNARHDQRAARTAQSAARRSFLPPLLRCTARCQAARAPVSKRGLRRHRRCQERLHHHQSSCGRERQRDHHHPARQPHLFGQGGRQRRRRGYRRAAGQAAESGRHDAGRLRQARSRRLRGRHRQSLRPAAHGHRRHRQRTRPHRHQPRRLRRLHPDRRLDQSRQFRRRAGQPARRTGRHQLRHPVAQRRQHRHRLRHPGQHGQGRDGPADQVRSGEARRARRATSTT